MKKYMILVIALVFMLTGCTPTAEVTPTPDPMPTAVVTSTPTAEPTPDPGPQIYTFAEFGAPVNGTGRFPLDESSSAQIAALVDLSPETVAGWTTVETWDQLYLVELTLADGRVASLEREQERILLRLNGQIYDCTESVDFDQLCRTLEAARLAAVRADLPQLTRLSIDVWDVPSFNREISLDAESSRFIWDTLSPDNWEVPDMYTEHDLARGWNDFVDLYCGDHLIARVTEGEIIGLEKSYTVIFYQIDGEKDQSAYIFAPEEAYKTLWNWAQGFSAEADPTPAPGSWVRLGPDETPPPGAWVKHYFEYTYDEESEGYISEDVTEYMVSTVTWSFDEDTKTLTFSGEGSLPEGMEDEAYWYERNFEWSSLVDQAEAIELAEGIIRIPKRAFYGFSKVTEVRLPSTLKIIEPTAFSHCGFSEIDLPEGLEELGSGAFSFCDELLHCEIPACMTQLLDSFRGCSKLETLTLHEGLDTIGSECFDGCDSLKRIVIPASVSWLGDQNIQYGSTGLRTMVFLGPPPNPILEPDVGYTIMDCIPKGMTIYYPDYEVERGPIQDDDWSNYVGKYDGYAWVAGLPEDLPASMALPPINVEWHFDEETGTLSFEGTGAMPRNEWAHLSDKVASIVIREGITKIADSAFHGFGKAETVTLPSTLTSIGKFAFYGCGIKELNIPGSVERIGEGAFKSCGELRSCDIWGNISVLEPVTFGYCSSLQSVWFMGEGLTELKKDCLQACGQINTLVIPGSVTSMEKIGAEGVKVLVFRGEPPAMPQDPDTGEYFTEFEHLTRVYYPEGSAKWPELSKHCREDVLWAEGIPQDGV